MGTEIRHEPDELGRLVGDTVWAARVGDTALIGAAWEWVEARPGVPAVRDPNGFVSNARIVAVDGADLTELQAIVVLNMIAHSTAWQCTVAHLTHDARGATALGKIAAMALGRGLPVMRPRMPAANAAQRALAAMRGENSERSAA